MCFYKTFAFIKLHLVWLCFYLLVFVLSLVSSSTSCDVQANHLSTTRPNFKGKFAIRHRYFPAFAKAHRSIVSEHNTSPKTEGHAKILHYMVDINIPIPF
jgi:hypothetical protein